MSEHVESLCREAGSNTYTALVDLEQMLAQAHRRQLLDVPEPMRAAEHFCSLIKGTAHFRLLISYVEQLDAEDVRDHVEDCVALFMRAYAGEINPGD
ncbi:TetR/AcrR family transcriptional regulator C-terminal domain-containing protein [Stutzerimonas stutzeri]|uniref:TetR/AcrR family transcriptional regulator C-terminal domain-containing protein n=1 Tax=Stutzerimonas stutzeri TaxID=316 RepID=UPI00210B2275|nr:TetR/AcrR family transcriptional regulator C-terminal domain-containing protein [Stutzerimonas stutzeri]MCQ4320308.1 TetR/AcrR family transcriptional regulator C-terminal domain-containing protein [Stutzerimonas stutzeri]